MTILRESSSSLARSPYDVSIDNGSSSVYHRHETQLEKKALLVMSLCRSSGDQGYHIDGLVQDSSISIANALEILQSCTKSSICSTGRYTTAFLVAASVFYTHHEPINDYKFYSFILLYFFLNVFIMYKHFLILFPLTAIFLYETGPI